MAQKLHVGEPCFACGKLFVESDDIVVCPECGTPYHRACWEKNGTCINLPLHESGKSWGAKKGTEILPPVCPNCGTKNEIGATVCRNCGTALGDYVQLPSWEQPPAEPEPEKQEPASGSIWDQAQQQVEQLQEEELQNIKNENRYLEGEDISDVSTFIGSNQIYFLPKFANFAQGHQISVNFSCFLFPFYYLAYRKMWALALIVAIISALLAFPQNVYLLPDYFTQMLNTAQNMTPELEEALTNMIATLEDHATLLYNASLICEWLDFFLMLFLGLFGNWIYYRHTLREVKKARESIPEPGARQNLLRMKGGTNAWLILAIGAISYALTLLLVGIVIAILMLT